MNMWGLTPEFLDLLEIGFADFFAQNVGNELKAEYLLPIYIGQLLREKKVSVKVLETSDRWFGVTYKADIASVRAAFEQLIEDGIYRKELFSDLKSVQTFHL